jgi:SAM-dependent methyltransferase
MAGKPKARPGGPARLDLYAEGGLSTVFYDLITRRDPAVQGDIDFYAALAPEGGSFLDLGCGTGRVALGLAERGFTVVGCDLAKTMLARAKINRDRASAEAAARVSFVQGDMAALSLGRRFDAVIAPFFGFAHLPAGAARRRALAAMARHLEPGGPAVIQLPLARSMASAPVEGLPEPLVDLAYDADGRRVALYARASRFERGRFDQTLEYVVTGPNGDILRRSRERLTFYDEDPVPLAGEAGLELERATPFNGVSTMLVFRRRAG